MCCHLSRILHEIDPDTAYVVCIPYIVSAFPYFPYMVSIILCFAYMVMLPKHLNVKAIVLDRALLWAAMDAALSQGPLLWRHNDKTVIVSWNTLTSLGMSAWPYRDTTKHSYYMSLAMSPKYFKLLVRMSSNYLQLFNSSFAIGYPVFILVM